MKTYKLILLTVLVFFLSNCEVKMQSANAKTDDNPNYSVNGFIDITVYKREGIEYRVFHRYNGGLHVINHTKELLEVELLKKALTK